MCTPGMKPAKDHVMSVVVVLLFLVLVVAVAVAVAVELVVENNLNGVPPSNDPSSSISRAGALVVSRARNSIEAPAMRCGWFGLTQESDVAETVERRSRAGIAFIVAVSWR